ncbi:MAG: TonB-dependent receptor [Flavobacteriales bacterium]
MKKRFTLFLSVLFLSVASALAQVKISGKVSDAGSGEAMYAVTVMQKDTRNGVGTDPEGNFTLTVPKLPVTLVISALGYTKQEYEVKSPNEKILIKMDPAQKALGTVEITGSRISEKQKQAPLTVESMDIIAIKETPSASFYEGLGNMKGVDLTSASIGFKVINTRGFNSTSPVRSLQLIDGVDNQSPGLNFSLGNFLGSSELDIKRVDIIQGASSSFYGPNAFNGVINMETKSPFDFTGLSVSAKFGERLLFEGAARWAQKFQNKKGRDIFAYKVNMYYMRANDWQATNYNPSTDSEAGKDNPGGYDAVNRYGDEALAGLYDWVSDSLTRKNFPGLGYIYRTGYKETDLVNYNSKNIKANVALHFMLTPKVEAMAVSNFGYGTTVYQGENRYNLKDILFFQNKIEFREKDKWFFRMYATNEDAGKTYDAVVTAFLMQNVRLLESNLFQAQNDPQRAWNAEYKKLWALNSPANPTVPGNTSFNAMIRGGNGAPGLPGMPSYQQPVNAYDYLQADAVMALYHDSLVAMHNIMRAYMDSMYYLMPGTPEFQAAFDSITSNPLGQGGSRFVDRSALYHAHGEYKFRVWKNRITFTTGLAARLYAPNSQGTIFIDTAGTRIYNFEAGAYLGIDLKLEKVLLSLTNRVDKNINFPFLWSPAFSVVYTPHRKHTLRFSFSSAIRNPTLADQYFNYNVGRATLRGNISGYDSLITTESFIDYIRGEVPDFGKLRYFNVDPVRPERVYTAEIGYRGTLGNNFYLDFSAYYSLYNNFIGYRIGVETDFNLFTSLPVNTTVLRVASNSKDIVHTRGVSVQAIYNFAKFFNINGNYSYNELDRRGSTDPLIPAFNTPRHKFNVGFGARDIMWKIKKVRLNNWGFNINYKWVEGFRFEGSPQFTGEIPSYGTLDAQISWNYKKAKTTFKIGAQNLTNNMVYQVYGGPRVGRLAYISIQFDNELWGRGNKKNGNKR